MKPKEALKAVDRFQQGRPRLSFVTAVIKKFGDDEAGQLAALIAYYGFISIFPLLLTFVTILGFVLQGNAKAQQSILHSTLSQFPIIGTQLQSNVRSLKGSAVSLVIGVFGSLLAGLGVTSATQNAFNSVWGVPRTHRPNFLFVRLRGIVVLLVLGGLNILSTASAGFVSTRSTGALALIAGILVALVINLVLFFAAFRLLTALRIPARSLLPGVIFGAIAWQALQHVGGLYINHVVRHAKDTAGLFALVLGLLAWLYLGGQVTLLAAEINVVRARRLWPRSLFSRPLTDADKEVFSTVAESQERIVEEDVDVSFDAQQEQEQEQHTHAQQQGPHYEQEQEQPSP
jgi:YihY family inner membrane protein